MDETQKTYELFYSFRGIFTVLQGLTKLRSVSLNWLKIVELLSSLQIGKKINIHLTV